MVVSKERMTLLLTHSRLENKIQDEVHRLRKEEGMRALGPERMARTVEDFTEKYGLEKFPEILNEIKKKEEKLGHVSRERPPSLRPAVFYF